MAVRMNAIIEMLKRVREAAQSGMVAGNLAFGSVDQIAKLCRENNISLKRVGTSEAELRELYRQGLKSEAVKVLEEMRLAGETDSTGIDATESAKYLVALLPDAKCSLEDLGTDEQEIKKLVERYLLNVEKYWASFGTHRTNALLSWFRSLFQPKRAKRLRDYGANMIENYKIVSFGKVGPTWPTEDEILKPEAQWQKRWAYRDGKTFQQKINEVTSGMK